MRHKGFTKDTMTIFIKRHYLFSEPFRLFKNTITEKGCDLFFQMKEQTIFRPT